MTAFNYQNGQLMAEKVPLHDVAERFGTPAYVYSKSQIESQWQLFDSAFAERDHLVCYAVKANSNLAILNLLANMGSGFDIVSIGELERVLKAGGQASKIVFSGVGKTADEMRRALAVGIKCFNVESISELQRLNDIAIEMNQIAPVSLRINPDVDAETHPYISTGLNKNKFGIQYSDAMQAYELANSLSNIEVCGIDCHIGSQITSTSPYMDSLDRLLRLIDALHSLGINIRHIDVGGGMGIQYQDEVALNISDFINKLSDNVGNRNLEILIEPGRSIVAHAGVLLTRVEYIKENSEKNFAIIDAAMNDLIRPALYQAWQDIQPVDSTHNSEVKSYDVVGPVCETGDFLGLDRELAILEGDLLAIHSSGAYGFSMSSNYNSRPRAVEVMVDGDKMHEIRRREQLSDLYLGEIIPPT
jgi:diaminopimelate decarboxylase